MRVMYAVCIVLLAACGGGYAARGAGTTVVISGDTVLHHGVEIPDTVTCIIKPGSTLRFAGYYRFVVRGLLIAEGTKDRPILITGVDRPRGAMEPPCWQGFEIRGERANAVFTHCRVEGAYRNSFYQTHPVITECEFVGNHCAIHCANKAAPSIKNNRIYRNTYGIIADFASPLVLDNVITENEVGVLMMRSSSVIAGRNTIAHNVRDLYSEKSFGENSDALSLKYLWDLMNQLY